MTKKEIILLIPVGFILITMAGIALYLYSHTFVSPWLILGIASGLGMIAGGIILALRQTKRWSYSLITLISIFITSCCGLLSVNYFGRDTYQASHEKAIIVSKHTEERSRTRRAGRRYVASGEKYIVYFITLQFNNGHRKNLEVSPSEYIKTRIGKKRSVTLSTGLLGWPIYTLG